MSNPQQHQHQNQQKQQPRDTFDGVTYYLVPSEDPDREKAQRYLRDRKVEPSRQVRVVTELFIERLTDAHRVIALYRNTRADRNTTSTVQGEDGRNRRVVETTHADVRETAPINCADFWVKASASVDDILDGMISDGELNKSAFLEELGKRIVPATISYHPDRGEPLRIRYA